MKKFFALAAIAATVMSANADVTTLYIAGPSETTINGTVLANWDIVNTLEVSLNRGKFVLECQNLSQIAISDKKIETEDWGNWGTGLWAMTAAFTADDLGKPMPLSGPGAGNFMAPWKGDWTLEIAADLSTVTLTTTTPQPEASYNLVGDSNIGWSAVDQWKFEKETDTVYWLDVTEENKLTGPLDNMNIIKDASWEVWWGFAQKPIVASEEANAWLWQENGAGKSLEEGETYSGTIRLEVPVAIEAGCTASVTFFPTIVEHVTPGAGVANVIVNETGETEYFTLQGIKVAEPKQGAIYIIRKGSQVNKIIY